MSSCDGVIKNILFGKNFVSAGMLRSLALRPPAVSQSAPPFLSLLFPFSGTSFFLFFFFFFSQFKSEVRKAVFISNRSYRSSFSVVRDGFFSVVFLLYPPYLLSFQRFSTRSRGSCTRFLFPDFLLIFSLVSEERAEK